MFECEVWIAALCLVSCSLDLVCLNRTDRVCQCEVLLSFSGLYLREVRAFIEVGIGDSEIVMSSMLLVENSLPRVQGWPTIFVTRLARIR